MSNDIVMIQKKLKLMQKVYLKTFQICKFEGRWQPWATLKTGLPSSFKFTILISLKTDFLHKFFTFCIISTSFEVHSSGYI